ncbi:hypothetical protein ANANG_G00299090 [Anguilla anguilla]|uniref:Uncharacterized protein n=1 Tax=Anguilla anguilla TaxID=7936 RepID=A0A9D3LIS5_ANGAN|nr:hypothetical protein ANANG_G00299090 [Anguilla anguilla]
MRGVRGEEAGSVREFIPRWGPCPPVRGLAFLQVGVGGVCGGFLARMCLLICGVHTRVGPPSREHPRGHASPTPTRHPLNHGPTDRPLDESHAKLKRTERQTAYFQSIKVQRRRPGKTSE